MTASPTSASGSFRLLFTLYKFESTAEIFTEELMHIHLNLNKADLIADVARRFAEPQRGTL